MVGKPWATAYLNATDVSRSVTVTPNRSPGSSGGTAREQECQQHYYSLKWGTQVYVDRHTKTERCTQRRPYKQKEIFAYRREKFPQKIPSELYTTPCSVIIFDISFWLFYSILETICVIIHLNTCYCFLLLTSVEFPLERITEPYYSQSFIRKNLIGRQTIPDIVKYILSEVRSFDTVVSLFVLFGLIWSTDWHVTVVTLQISFRQANRQKLFVLLHFRRSLIIGNQRNYHAW